MSLTLYIFAVFTQCHFCIFFHSAAMNAQYMNPSAGAPYPPQTGVAMDMSTYHNSNMPPVSYPVAAPPHQAPQQQQAVYYQQPLL